MTLSAEELEALPPNVLIEIATAKAERAVAAARAHSEHAGLAKARGLLSSVQFTVPIGASEAEFHSARAAAVKALRAGIGSNGSPMLARARATDDDGPPDDADDNDEPPAKAKKKSSKLADIIAALVKSAASDGPDAHRARAALAALADRDDPPDTQTRARRPAAAQPNEKKNMTSKSNPRAEAIARISAQLAAAPPGEREFFRTALRVISGENHAKSFDAPQPQTEPLSEERRLRFQRMGLETDGDFRGVRFEKYRVVVSARAPERTGLR